MATVTPQHLFRSVAQLRDAIGDPLGHSAWLTVDQQRINEFASATRDDQWIHVDPERAASGPFGSTIAHGWLTVSLLPMLSREVYRVEADMAINYGSDRVRFLAPVPVGSRIRATVTIADIVPGPEGCRVTTTLTADLENSARPACVANFITMWVGLVE